MTKITLAGGACCCSMGYGNFQSPEFPCYYCPRHPDTVMRQEGHACKRHTKEKLRIELANDQLDDLVELWHLGAGKGQELHEFLGMTWEEYRAWGGDMTKVPERMIDDLVKARP